VLYPTSATSSLALLRNWPSYQYRAENTYPATKALQDHAVRPPRLSDIYSYTGGLIWAARHVSRSFSCQVPGPGSELDMSAKFCFVKKTILGRVAFADGKSAGSKKRGLCRIREIWERR